jgi:dipeptidyl aminopeptidase/acylaminoacyl peptidase
MAPRPVPRPTARPSARDRITVEQIVAVDPPTSFRVAPDGRSVAYVAEAGGARQLFTLSLGGGYPVQLTAFEKDVSDPRWDPSGERLAFVKETAIWVVDADGGRATRVADHPAGNTSPRWAPDGERLSFLSRRRGWTQLWLLDVPRPARGRPPAVEKLAEPKCLTPGAYDIEDPVWSPDGRRLAYVSSRSSDLRTQQILVLDVEGFAGSGTASASIVAGQESWACGPRWTPDGSAIVFVDDRRGWMDVYVVDVGADGGAGECTRLTDGELEHGDPSGSESLSPRVSPDGRHVAYVRVHEGLVGLAVRPLEGGAPPVRRRGRSRRRPVAGLTEVVAVEPFPALWRLVDWIGDDRLAVIAENDERPQDLWLLPVPGLAAPTARARQVTDSRPRAVPVHRFVASERITFSARDGIAIEGTLWRPPEATGRHEGRRVPVVVHLHGGPTAQAFRGWWPFFQLLAQDGIAVLAIDFRGSTGYGRAFRWANRGQWGHADAHDVIDAARWAASQPWADGRLGLHGGSYGGYLVLCALTEEPDMWRAGVDLYGDSEIAESYRHGDRLGRIDLERMMGRPDDPDAAPGYRRGSPVYRAERIAAPLLILHGRQDRRVVPLMSERMVEALAIEGKYHEIHWYDDEAHGWQRRENRRDAYNRIVAFLKRHLLDEESPAP